MNDFFEPSCITINITQGSFEMFGWLNPLIEQVISANNKIRGFISILVSLGFYIYFQYVDAVPYVSTERVDRYLSIAVGVFMGLLVFIGLLILEIVVKRIIYPPVGWLIKKCQIMIRQRKVGNRLRVEFPRMTEEQHRILFFLLSEGGAYVGQSKDVERLSRCGFVRQTNLIDTSRFQREYKIPDYLVELTDKLLEGEYSC